MNNFYLAMTIKGLIFSTIVYVLWLIIPVGRVKTALFRERPWNVPAWLVSMSLLILVFGVAAYRIITGS